MMASEGGFLKKAKILRSIECAGLEH